jgi:D-xylose transport system substrate-binding protein
MPGYRTSQTIDLTATNGSTETLSRRRLLVGTAAVTAGGLLGAFAPSEVRAAAGKKVGFLVPDYDQLRWKNGDQRYFEEEAKRLGLVAIAQSSNGSESTQANQVDNMLTQGVDVLVITPVNVDAAAGLVAKANAQNVPVIAYNFLIDNAPIVGFVGRENKQVGVDLAKAALAAAPKGNYVLYFGDEGTSVAREKAQGNLDTLKPFVDKGDIKIVAQQFVRQWSTAVARSLMENALTKANNSIAAVVASNDGIAYGVIQALESQGLAGKVYVTGEDAEYQALQLIRDGKMGVTSFTPFNEMGIQAARAAALVAAGKPFPGTKKINNKQADIAFLPVPAFNVDKASLKGFAEKYPWWANPGQLKL